MRWSAVALCAVALLAMTVTAAEVGEQSEERLLTLLKKLEKELGKRDDTKLVKKQLTKSAKTSDITRDITDIDDEKQSGEKTMDSMERRSGPAESAMVNTMTELVVKLLNGCLELSKYENAPADGGETTTTTSSPQDGSTPSSTKAGASDVLKNMLETTIELQYYLIALDLMETFPFPLGVPARKMSSSSSKLGVARVLVKDKTLLAHSTGKIDDRVQESLRSDTGKMDDRVPEARDPPGKVDRKSELEELLRKYAH